jgi:hypothetical protein
VRRKLFSFLMEVLDAESFDPGRVNAYCGTG